MSFQCGKAIEQFRPPCQPDGHETTINRSHDGKSPLLRPAAILLRGGKMIGQRDERVDFFRGLALVFIFWDHIPGSVFGDVTVRNFGLSDAAEIFVFLAGYSAGAAYVALAGAARRGGSALARRTGYPISKTDLSPWRRLHFLALTEVVAAWLKPGARLARPAAAHLRRMGRLSLEVFRLTVILAPLADMANTLAGDGYAAQAATALSGVAAMAGLALLIEWARRPQVRGAPTAAPARP